MEPTRTTPPRPRSFMAGASAWVRTTGTVQLRVIIRSGSLEGLVEEVIPVVHRSGGVDEQADLDPGDGGKDPVGCIGVGEVDDQCPDCDPVPLGDARRDLVEQRAVPGDEHQIEALGSDLVGRGLPHTL